MFLGDILSVINDSKGAKDESRAFTYIEFVKEYGAGENPDDFLGIYKEYLLLWSQKKSGDFTLTNEEFVQEKLIDVLKTITLDYSSYEEQDFIANLDWKNPNHLRSVLPLFCRKIREITEFYRKKRNEAHLTVNRNSFKGSTKNIEEIIYEKIFDYIFNNKDVGVQYADIKRDLLISIESYVDTYSEYFDIPRHQNVSKNTRGKMLSANMNDVDWQDYLKISSVLADTIYSGNMYLQEIPLIASIGLDFSQECVGDMLALKNTLLSDVTVNQIPVTEQIALRRKFYEKFLGVDLYYLYTDENADIVKMDVMCYAKNKTGNLLNVGTVDRAVTEAEQLELLSRIGLFFKPDKTSIIKVSAKDYSWKIYEDDLQANTMYVFPDPDKYGDIGNNKSQRYPFTMRYKMDYDIKNMSSGVACDDPLVYITDTSWRAYYSKQDEDFRIIDNKNWNYSFTNLANKGILHQYQVDAFGNQFGLIKGGNIIHYDENGNVIPEDLWSDDDYSIVYEFAQGTIDVPEHPDGQEVDEHKPLHINGGYFENPYVKNQPFDFTRKQRIDDYYNWSGVQIQEKPLIIPKLLYQTINVGQFGHDSDIKYQDHWQYTGSESMNEDITKDRDQFLSDELKIFYSKSMIDGNADSSNVSIQTKPYSIKELREQKGNLWIKYSDSIEHLPELFEIDGLDEPWKDVISFQILNKTIVLEYDNYYRIIAYDFDGVKFSIVDDSIKIEKLMLNQVLYVESEMSFYIFSINDMNERIELVVKMFNCSEKKLHTILDYTKDEYPDDNFTTTKSDISFIKQIRVSYNGSLGQFLLTYAKTDDVGTPYIYEHRFKLGDKDTFEQTLQSNVYTTAVPTEYATFIGELLEEMTDGTDILFEPYGD